MVCYLRGRAREDNQINGSDKLEGELKLLNNFVDKTFKTVCVPTSVPHVQLNKRLMSTTINKVKTHISIFILILEASPSLGLLRFKVYFSNFDYVRAFKKFWTVVA